MKDGEPAYRCKPMPAKLTICWPLNSVLLAKQANSFFDDGRKVPFVFGQKSFNGFPLSFGKPCRGLLVTLRGCLLFLFHAQIVPHWSSFGLPIKKKFLSTIGLPLVDRAVSLVQVIVAHLLHWRSA